MKQETLLFNRLSGGPLVALNCFPNTYTVGMSSLGYQTIFKLYASNPKTHTFRYFTDWHESHPKDIDLMTFSISWELDFINLLEILHQLGIPFKACDRGPEHPLILGGGPVLTANPEPWAEFFDLISIGDSENNTDDIIDTCLEYVNSEKCDLNIFSKIPGIYLPHCHCEAQSAEAIPLQRMEIASSSSSSPRNDSGGVSRQKSKSNQLASSSVIAPESSWGDIGLLEVVRSCPEMCRFCLASYLALPFRAPDLESDLIPKAEELLEHTNTIGLLGASVTQHPEFMNLLQYLAEHPNKPRVQVASIRASTVTQEMCELLVQCGVKSITIAIETGSTRLRDIINKKLPEEYIFSAAKYAREAGMQSIKLYGMVGLPHEIDEDIDATIDMLTRLKQENKSLKIIWGCSVFTPKAQTPFQDYGVDSQAESKLKRLIKALKPQGIDVREESFKWAQVQALISRGDRSINDTMIQVYQSKQTGFGIYKKLLDPKDYKHFVFDDWSRIIENGSYSYPWDSLISEDQGSILNQHKESAKTH